MIVVTVFFSILNQMEFHLVQKIERKTVTTMISHSIWREIEIWFSQCRNNAVRPTAVRGTRVSRCHGGPIECPPGTPVHHNTIVLRSLRGANNWAINICRETPVSRAADIIFSSVQAFKYRFCVTFSPVISFLVNCMNIERDIFSFWYIFSFIFTVDICFVLLGLVRTVVGLNI